MTGWVTTSPTPPPLVARFGNEGVTTPHHLHHFPTLLFPNFICGRTGSRKRGHIVARIMARDGQGRTPAILHGWGWGHGDGAIPVPPVAVWMGDRWVPPPPLEHRPCPDALKAKHLSAMSTTAGWTIGVVLALLLAVLLVSAWGTARGPRPPPTPALPWGWAARMCRPQRSPRPAALDGMALRNCVLWAGKGAAGRLRHQFSKCLPTFSAGVAGPSRKRTHPHHS